MTSVGHKPKLSSGPALSSAHRSRDYRPRPRNDTNSSSGSSVRTKGPNVPATIQENASTADTSLAPASSKDQESLTGSRLHERAFQVTRRLSHSVYMMQDAQRVIQKRRSTIKANSVDDTASIQYEPNYRIEPSSKFNTKQVVEAIRDVLEMHLRGRDYDAKLAPLWTTHISSELNDRVKMLDMTRYRFVCHVVLGQKQENSIFMASRCAWDQTKDSFACAEYETPTMTAIATVHGVYLD